MSVHADLASQLRMILSRPGNEAALVAWDRDLEHVAATHDHHWGDCNSDGELWVSFMPRSCDADHDLYAPHACCQYRFDRSAEVWVRKPPSSWSARTLRQCPQWQDPHTTCEPGPQVDRITDYAETQVPGSGFIK